MEQNTENMQGAENMQNVENAPSAPSTPSAQGAENMQNVESTPSAPSAQNITPHPMTRWSNIRDLAVVAINTGSKIGYVEDFYFDPQSSVVRAVQIKTGMFGHRIVLPSAITSLGEHAIIISDEKQLVPAKEHPELAHLPLGNSLMEFQILSQAGKVVGNVGNVVLEATPEALRIHSFELSGGLFERISGHYNVVPTDHIISYGKGIIIIQDDAGGTH